MASNTPNYDLKKPAATDFYNVADQNENMDKLDAALKGLADGKAALGADGKIPSAQLPEMNYAPTTHAAQHASGGSDPVMPDSIGAAAAIHSHDDLYYTKAQNLSSATAALFGVDAAAVPNDVLSLLGRFHSGLGNDWIWRKEKIQYLVREKGWSCDGNFPLAEEKDYPITIQFSDGIKNNNGVLELLEPIQSITLNSCNEYSKLELLKGKYFLHYQVFYKIIAYSRVESGYSFKTVSFVNPIGCVCSAYVDFTDISYVNSSDSSAYPPAIPDGYIYTALGQIGDTLKIATGSYAGTGTNGSTNPNSLTFDFKPKLVIVGTLRTYSDYWQSSFLWHVGDTGISTRGLSTGGSISVTQQGNTLEWYSTLDAKAQINLLNTIYHYIAIG